MQTVEIFLTEVSEQSQKNEKAFSSAEVKQCSITKCEKTTNNRHAALCTQVVSPPVSDKQECPFKSSEITPTTLEHISAA